MHGRKLLEWFATIYPDAVQVIAEKNLQLGSGAIPSEEEIDIEMIDDAPVPRNQQMSESMKTKLTCDTLRVDQAIAFLERTVAANTYTVRIKDIVRIKG
jgi:hypothetical protein